MTEPNRHHQFNLGSSACLASLLVTGRLADPCTCSPVRMLSCKIDVLPSQSASAQNESTSLRACLRRLGAPA
jgi:hypothetical protein